MAPVIVNHVKWWRVGARVKLNVYQGDRPVCQCHSEEDAARIVRAMNAWEESQSVRDREAF